MKNVKNFLMAIAVAGISASNAFAQDAFRLGINVGGDVKHSTYSYDTHNHGAYHQATPYYSAPVVIYYAPPVVYYETVRQHDHTPNIIYRHSNDEHSQYYRGENVGQPSNPRWSAGAGNQSYSDGNNGRNYRGYLSDNDQGHRNNHQHRHHNGYR